MTAIIFHKKKGRPNVACGKFSVEKKKDKSLTMSAAAATDLEQVQVRFTTQQQQYAITESAIFVPADFKRYGLSGIVNHLLGNGKDS
jgi:hypothetical protein